MARYRKVDPRMWNDEKFAALSRDGKLAFVFILTHPSLTSVGAMRGNLTGLAAELGIPLKGFREPFAKGLLKADEKAHYIEAPNFLKYNPPENPNVVKGWVKALDLIPECRMKRELIQRLKRLLERLPEPFGKPFREPFANGMPNQEQEQEQEQETPPPTSSSSDPPDGLNRMELLRQTWNQIDGVKKCHALGKTFRVKFKARLQEYPEMDWWANLFQLVRSSDFLCGRKAGTKGPFHVSLDWVLGPINLDKVLAGNYSDHTPQDDGKIKAVL